MPQGHDLYSPGAPIRRGPSALLHASVQSPDLCIAIDKRFSRTSRKAARVNVAALGRLKKCARQKLTCARLLPAVEIVRGYGQESNVAYHRVVDRSPKTLLRCQHCGDGPVTADQKFRDSEGID